MLSAVMVDGTYVLAFDVPRGSEGPFLCPECRQEVIHKAGRIKVWHFAHRADTTSCTYGGSESEDHLLGKIEIYQALKAVPGVEKLEMEPRLGDVRPDVIFVYQGQYVALEIQMSDLSPDQIEWRTRMYTNQNIAVLWMVPLYEELNLDQERYTPRVWERYLHTLYFGKVYYWIEDLQLQPIKFGNYLLAPDRYGRELRARRYATPEWLKPVSLLDLTSVWRKPFKTRLGSFPQAKIWCEPYQVSGTPGTNHSR